MNELGNLLNQGANRPQNRASVADALGATARNINYGNMQTQGMDPMVMLTQMMYKMKTQREADQSRHEEQMQFEADERHEEARQGKAE